MTAQLAQIYKDAGKDRKFEVVLVSYDDDDAAGAAYLKDSKQEWPGVKVSEVENIKAVTDVGIVGAHLLRGDEAASRTPTQEKAMRDRPDDISAWIAFVEALEPSYLTDLRTERLSNDALRNHGVSNIASGLYRLHYTLTEVDVAAGEP